MRFNRRSFLSGIAIASAALSLPKSLAVAYEETVVPAPPIQRDRTDQRYARVLWDAVDDHACACSACDETVIAPELGGQPDGFYAVKGSREFAYERDLRQTLVHPVDADGKTIPGGYAFFEGQPGVIWRYRGVRDTVDPGTHRHMCQTCMLSAIDNKLVGPYNTLHTKVITPGTDLWYAERLTPSWGACAQRVVLPYIAAVPNADIEEKVALWRMKQGHDEEWYERQRRIRTRTLGAAKG